MTKTKLIGGVVAAAALLVPAVGAAQNLDLPLDPAFEPLGVRAGAFLVYPSLALTGDYDDNVFATSSDEDDDFIFTVRPELRAESQWSRHQLTARAFGEFGFFLDETDSNYEDFGAQLDGRLDVTRDSRSTGRLLVARLTESRDDQERESQVEPNEYWNYEARLGHRHNFVRFFVQPTVFARRTSFEDSDDRFRDRNRYGVGLRGGYALSPRISLFLETNGDLVVYDNTDTLDRDSKGFDVRAGTEVDISRLVVGEASLGYTRREYDDDSLETIDGVAGDLGISWYPTQLTTVNFTGSAGVEETRITFEGDTSSGNLATDIGIGVTHSLRRNILLNADLAYERDDFQGTNRVDNTYRVGAGITYLLNRNFSVGANYFFSTRDSDDDNAEFDRNVFRIGVTARL